MSSILRKILYTILLIAGLGLLAVALYYYKEHNPMESRLFPQCAFLKITGYQCPGCGSQRAIHYLMNGEIGMSVKMNPLLWVAAIYLLIVAAFQIPYLHRRYSKFYDCLTGFAGSCSWLAAIILFWIFRNVF